MASNKQYWETRTPEQMKEWSERFSGEKHGMYGKKRSEELKKSVSDANSVSVMYMGIVYKSMKEASEKLGVTKKVFERMIKNEIKNNNESCKIFYKEGNKLFGKDRSTVVKRILFAGIEYGSLTECGISIGKTPERVGQIIREQIKKGNPDYKYL